MTTVFFGHFGGKDHPSSHFKSYEQVLLKLAVDEASYSISQALIAANKNFAGHYDNIKLWFGEVTQEMIVYLKKAVYKMHSTFTDPETFIKFIDARGQYSRPILAMLPLDNVTDEHYDALIMKGGPRVIPPRTDRAAVFPLSWPNSDDKYHSHAGSVLNIYIRVGFFGVGLGHTMRTQILLHEYSHKVIGTVDYAVSIPDPNKAYDCRLIYGIADCLWLATQNSQETIRNADCWGYFLSSFRF